MRRSEWQRAVTNDVLSPETTRSQYRDRVNYRLMGVSFALVSGCAARNDAFGIGGTGATQGGGGFSATLSQHVGTRVGEHFDIGIGTHVHFGAWKRTAAAYGAITDWAASGKVECCGELAGFVTMFKYFGVLGGYGTAWLIAMDTIMVAPRIRYYVNPYAPTTYFDLGAGPAAYFDDERGDLLAGAGATVAAGHWFDPNWGLEARAAWGNIDDPQWATFTVGVVSRARTKRVGLFGKTKAPNDLERPPPPPPPPAYYPPPHQPYPSPQGYPPPQQPYPSPPQPAPVQPTPTETTPPPTHAPPSDPPPADSGPPPAG